MGPSSAVSDGKEITVGKPKEHGGQVRAPPPTQGHRKALQRLEDLCQNDRFGPELAAILLIPDPKERSRRLGGLAAACRLEIYYGAPWMELMVDRSATLQESDLDFCHVVDEAKEILTRSDSDCYLTPPNPLPNKAISVVLYPIHLCISPWASKRDVLDHVAKNWRKIRSLLDSYYKGPRVIRRRKKEERDQFIWKNRGFSSETISARVWHQFGESLDESRINGILAYMGKRYSKI